MPKEYTYVELNWKNRGGDYKFGEDSTSIYASNDTLAFLNAYELFCRSKQFEERMSANGVLVIPPMGFYLYDEEGKAIDDTFFNIKAEKAAIKRKVAADTLPLVPDVAPDKLHTDE